jgi:thiamine-phosphate pyrophosphorylase
MEKIKDMKTNNLPKTMFITHKNEKYSYLSSGLMALECGIKFIQLRMKDYEDEKVIEVAKELAKECNKQGALLTVDDRINLLSTNLFSGIHLGKEDMEIGKAKDITKQKYILGATANTIDDIINAYQKGASYIGLGPYKYTTTKKKLSTILGLNGYKDIIKELRDKGINIPIYAIGGIEVEDLQELKETGVYGVALSSVILNSNNARKTIEEILKVFPY